MPKWKLPVGYYVVLIMMKRTIFAFGICMVIFTCVSFPTFAQQKISLLNGKVLNVESFSIGEMFVNYKLSGDSPKKLRLVDKYDVFSVTNAENREDILYKPMDSADFSIEDARLYMDGENAARIYFNKPGVKISSAGIGLVSGVLSFYSLPIPFFYGIAITQRNPKKMQLPEELKSMGNNEAYRFGYNREARNIKMKHSLKFGYIGLGLSLATLFLITR
jgi:hypothetical protein